MKLLDSNLPWPAGNLPWISVRCPQEGLVTAKAEVSLAALTESGRLSEVASAAESCGYTADVALPPLIEVPSEGCPCTFATVGTKDVSDEVALGCFVVVTPTDDPCLGACVPLRLSSDRTRILSAPGPWLGWETASPEPWGDDLAVFEYGQDDGDGLPTAATYVATEQDPGSLGCTALEAANLMFATDMARHVGVVPVADNEAVPWFWREALYSRAATMGRLWSVLQTVLEDLSVPEPPKEMPWGPWDYISCLSAPIRDALVEAAMARHGAETGTPMDAGTLADILDGRVADLSEGPAGSAIAWWDLLALARWVSSREA